MLNVRDFGAKGDGVTNDTVAIQKAVNAGGMVRFPPGVYLTGTVYLLSHGGLFLEAGAVLKASPDPADYNDVDFCMQNRACPQEKAFGAHLIAAVEQEDVTLCGDGIIDGSYESFFDPVKVTRGAFEGWRPSQMVFFCECRNVKIRDVSMIRSPYWACYVYGCENVHIRSVTIRSCGPVWNGDGLDIDCSRRVTVSDCDIDSSDDSLTIRASGVDRLHRAPGLTDQVTVRNCILRSGQAALRFGVGTGEIRNCTVSGLTCRSQYGIVFLSCYLPDEFPGGADGVEIHDILLSDIILDSKAPFDISSNWAMPPLKQSKRKIRNIAFRNILARGSWCSILQGNEDRNVSDIEFSDISLTMTGSDWIEREPKLPLRGWDVYRRPWAFYAVNTERVTFRRFTCRWQDENDRWKGAFYFRNNIDLNKDGCRFDAPVNGCREKTEA